MMAALVGSGMLLAELTLVAAVCQAEEPPVSPQAEGSTPEGSTTWTLERATKVAEERSPELQTARVALKAARAYRAFGHLPRIGNPTLGLRAMFGKPDDPAATYSASLGLPLDVSGRRRSWQREASFVEREAEAQLLAVQNEVRSEARDAFIDTSLSSELVRVAVANSEVAREFLQRVQARFAANAATALDVALSERDYAESMARVANAQAVLAESRGRLRQRLDLAADEPIEAAPLSPPGLPPELNLARAIELARAQRKEPAAFAAGAERFRAADKRLRRETVAPLVVGGEYEAQGNTNTQSSGGVHVIAELPFVFRNQGERAVARGQAELAHVRAGLSTRQVTREAVVTFQQLQAALQEFEALDGQATPAAERALSMTMEMLDAGAVDYFRLLNAREMAFELRARRVEALRVAWRRRIGLERALGSLEIP
jgi:outer membrane protein TolC